LNLVQDDNSSSYLANEPYEISVNEDFGCILGCVWA
jgi:hypothetical protein